MKIVHNELKLSFMCSTADILGPDINLQFLLSVSLVKTFSPLCPLQLLQRGWTLDLIPWTYGHTALWSYVQAILD